MASRNSHDGGDRQVEHEDDMEHEAATAAPSAPLLRSRPDGEPEERAERWWDRVHPSLFGRSTVKGRQRGDEADGEENEQVDAEHLSEGCFAHLKRKHRHLYYALIALLSLLLITLFLFVVALLHLLFVTLHPPDEETQQRIARHALNIQGPDQVRVLSMDEEGLRVRIDGRIGLDGHIALDEWLGARQSRSWWNKKERSLLEYIFDKVKGVQIDVGRIALRSPDWHVQREVEEVHLLPDDGRNDSIAIWTQAQSGPNPPMDLVTFHVEPLHVPVPPLGVREGRGAGPPAATTPLNLTVILKPLGPNLLAYAQDAMKNKTAILDVSCDNARLRGMSAGEWSRGELKRAWRWSVPGWVDLATGETWRRVAQKRE